MTSPKRKSQNGKEKGYLTYIAIFVLLWKPSISIPADPWKNYWFGNGILGKAEIFNTTVCFTIPLFSFSFPSLNDEENTCIVKDGDESCLPNDPSPTELFKQNVLGQVIFFGVTAISVAASLAFPAFLSNQVEELTDENNANSDTAEFPLEENEKMHSEEIATNSI